MFRRLVNLRPTLHLTTISRSYARAGRPANTLADDLRQLDRQSTQTQQRRHNNVRSSNDPDPDDASDFGRDEADFLQIGATHRAHRDQVAREHERIKHRTVGAKYFRTSHPNFLTWSEKEQIRRLHARSPNEWSVERLSEAFPADVATVAKLVRTQWTPRDAKRIVAHDRAVREAWQTFEAGEFGDMDVSLREHLQKFGARSVSVSDAVRGVAVEKRLPAVEVKEDFSKILTSCRGFGKSIAAPASTEAAVPAEVAFSLSGQAPNGQDTYLLGKVKRSRSMMFRELDVGQPPTAANETAKHSHNPFHDPRRAAKNVESEAVDEERDHELTLASPRMLPERLNQATTIPPAQNDDIVSKYQMTDVQSSDAELRRLSMPAIRDQITIPAKLWRRGATYKLNDCYYDDDGEFLYRVPGMTGNQS